MSNEEQPESKEFMKIERLTPSSKEVLLVIRGEGFSDELANLWCFFYQNAFLL